MSSTVASRVLAIVATHADAAPADALSRHELRLDDLGLSSADTINLIIDLEDAFDLEVEDEYIHTLRTVGDVIRAIEARVAPAPVAR
jgi:acyl carrier protein